MKKQKQGNRTILYVIILVLLFFLLMGCNKTPILSPEYDGWIVIEKDLYVGINYNHGIHVCDCKTGNVKRLRGISDLYYHSYKPGDTISSDHPLEMQYYPKRIKSEFNKSNIKVKKSNDVTIIQAK